MRSRSVGRGPSLKSIMRPRFGVRFSFSLSVAPKWGPKSDPHYGSIFLAGWWVLVSWKRAPRLATASTKNGPKNGDQTETVCYISVLACLALNFGPQTGATIPRSLRLGGSRAATTLAITLPGTLMYILPIKYHAKCSARLFQEYPRQVYTVCFSWGKLRATSLAEKATSVPRKATSLIS